MANKFWLGSQWGFDRLTSRPLDDRFSTITADDDVCEYTFAYHNVCDINNIKSMSLDDFITINSSGKPIPNDAAKPTWSVDPSTGEITPSITTPMSVLYKFYRGKGGTYYKEYKYKCNSTSYADVKAGSWKLIGCTWKTPEESGIKNYANPSSLPSVSSMTNAQIDAFLANGYKKVYMISFDGGDTVESLFGSKPAPGGGTESKTLFDLSDEAWDKCINEEL